MGSLFDALMEAAAERPVRDSAALDLLFNIAPGTGEALSLEAAKSDVERLADILAAPKKYTRAVEWGGLPRMNPVDEALKAAGSAGLGLLGAIPVLGAGTRVRKGLDMTKAAREARAAEMGFSPETFYHGSGQSFKEFDPRIPVYLTDDPVSAGHYAEGVHLGGSGNNPQIYPIKVRGKIKPLDEERLLDEVMEGDVDQFIADELAIAKQEGFGGVEFMHPSIGMPLDHRVVVTTPQNVRSIFAAFDPAKKDSADLLAGVAGASLTPLAYALMGGTEND